MIPVAASTRRRSTALSRMILAWYSTLAAVGTTSISAAMYSIPPARSRSPRRLSSSRRVTGSMTSPRSVRDSIDRNNMRWPAYSPPPDRSAVEEASGDTDVIPGWSLPVGVSQQRGRVIRDAHGDATEPVDLIAERAEGLFGVEQTLRGRPAHGQNDF